jgi:salicylate hydroxylase
VRILTFAPVSSTMDHRNSKKLQVAVIGAGIAGLTSYIALSRHPLINITIYERATELREIGASIALGPNGLRTLERLGITNALNDEVAFRGPSNLPMIYRHWKTGEVIGVDKFVNVKDWRVHLQQALLEHVPREKVRLGKKILGVDVKGEGVSLRFEDGTLESADLVLGADGLHSGVRQSFVPEFKLKWSGLTSFRAVFDASLVESIPGLPEDTVHWVGPETTLFSSKLGKNMYTVVGNSNEDPEDPAAVFKKIEWDEEAKVEILRKTYAVSLLSTLREITLLITMKHWNPVVKELTERTPSIRYHPNFSCAGPLDTWVFGGRVTLIGDAAHAHGGAYATGGSLAIDDAYAFYLALLSAFPLTESRKPSAAQITKALKLYEAIRKPHAERLLKAVHASNDAKIARIRGRKLETDEELKARVVKGSNTAWLHEHDVFKTFEEKLRRSLDLDSGLEKGLARL